MFRGKRIQRTPSVVGVNIEDVSDQRNTWRLRNWRHNVIVSQCQLEQSNKA